MTELGIHEELHRLILRQRFVWWAIRNWHPSFMKVYVLSHRLTKAKPTYLERHCVSS